MGKAKTKLLALMLTVGLMFGTMMALPGPAYADDPGLGDYALNDILFINQLIDDNGLAWDKWLDDEPAQPTDWDTHVDWANNPGDPQPYRMEGLYLSELGLSTVTNTYGLPGALLYLDISGNALATLPELPGGLVEFNCNNNQLTALTPLPVTLKTFDCSENLLTALPALSPNMQYLYCCGNQLTALPNLPSLIELDCSDNQISELVNLPSTLEFLNCRSNLLTALPNLPGSLKQLDCGENLITALPQLPGGLIELSCYENLLTALPTLSGGLEWLDCSGNQLPGLPTLPGSLLYLMCGDNLLPSLQDPLPGGLIVLDCRNNLLPAIPLPLPDTIYYLDISNNLLTAQPYPLPDEIHFFSCDDNQIQSIDIANCRYLEYVSATNNPLVQVVVSPTLTVRTDTVGNGTALITYFRRENLDEPYMFGFQQTPDDGWEFVKWEYDIDLFHSIEPDATDPDYLWGEIWQTQYRVPVENVVVAHFRILETGGVPTGDLGGLSGFMAALTTLLLGVLMLARRRQALRAL
ncbi:MAG: hypothetical protein FWH40_07695 [Coriobacteriia bacterium]|nr:hypothetical protein [Coriobacteriia bacterium]